MNQAGGRPPGADSKLETSPNEKSFEISNIMYMRGGIKAQLEKRAALDNAEGEDR